MAFEGLTQRLAGTFKKLKNRGKLSEADVKAVSYTHLDVYKRQYLVMAAMAMRAEILP